MNLLKKIKKIIKRWEDRKARIYEEKRKEGYSWAMRMLDEGDDPHELQCEADDGLDWSDNGFDRGVLEALDERYPNRS